MADMTVARTILAQLGGQRFLMMTGAKNLVGGEDKLVFRLNGRMTKHGINMVSIQLQPSDTYEVLYMRVRGTKVTVVDRDADVYCDMLENCFERATGLLTSMSGRRVAFA
jgi:hypothetical protein